MCQEDNQGEPSHLTKGDTLMSIAECNSIHNTDNAFKNCSVLFIKVTKFHIPIMYYMISEKKKRNRHLSLRTQSYSSEKNYLTVVIP